MLKSLGLWKSSYEEMASSFIQSSAYQPAGEASRESRDAGAGDATTPADVTRDWVPGNVDFGSTEHLPRWVIPFNQYI